MTDDLLTPETIQQRFRTAECDCRVFADGITIQTVCVECRELVDALLRYGAQCAREAQPQWQPIETAPKDRPILLWERDANCATVGRWNDSYTEKWHAMVHGEDTPWNDWDPSPIFEATHWMPLPDPPAVNNG